MVRVPTDRPPTHPGEMLLEEFLKPLGLTQTELAQRIGALRGEGVAAASVEALLAVLQQHARAGDTVVFMSNGGFEGAPRRFAAALASG